MKYYLTQTGREFLKEEEEEEEREKVSSQEAKVTAHYEDVLSNPKSSRAERTEAKNYLARGKGLDIERK